MKELHQTCSMALWFLKSDEKRAALAKALASGKKKEIVSVAKKVLNSVKDPKTKKRLSKVLASLEN